MTDPQELPYWVGLNQVRGIGPAKFRALLDYFGSAAAAWHAGEESWREAGIDARAAANLREARSTADLAAQLARAGENGVTVLTWDDEVYPRYLKEIADPPPILYVRGQLEARDEWGVAVVGTRRATTYGRHVARELVLGLARSGVTVVSGLARGIDAIVHQAALEAEGRTIAVLGSGIDQVYPPEHRQLAQRIAAQGALLSEFAPDTPPEAGNFPRRNRIISGLSLGVLVIEADQTSGALITAQCGLDQGRDVFAVPGNINSRASRGTNRLIQRGAKLVLSAQDVLEELNMTMVTEQVATQMALPATPEEAQLLQLLSQQPCHVDDLIRAASMPAALVTSTLTLMELKGSVRQVEGMSFVCAREEGEDYRATPPGAGTR